MDKVRDPYSDRTYHVMLLQSELYSQTNLVLAHQINVNSREKVDLRNKNQSALSPMDFEHQSRNENLTMSTAKKQGDIHDNKFNILQWMSVNNKVNLQQL